MTDERVYGDNSSAVLMAINDDVFYDDNYDAFYGNKCWADFTAKNDESFYDDNWRGLLKINDDLF